MKDYQKWAEQVRAAQRKLAERAEKARAKRKERQ